MKKTCTQCGEAKPIAGFYTRTPSELSRIKVEKRSAPYHLVMARCKSCYKKHQAQYRSGRRSVYQTKASEYSQRRRLAMSPDEFAALKMRYAEKQKSKYLALKEKVYSVYGFVCACCGETQSEFLTLDHVDNDGTAHRKLKNGRSQGTNILHWIIANNYPTNIQILCWNCQWGKRKNNGVCPHRVAQYGHRTASAVFLAQVLQ